MQRVQFKSRRIEHRMDLNKTHLQMATKYSKSTDKIVNSPIIKIYILIRILSRTISNGQNQRIFLWRIKS